MSTDRHGVAIIHRLSDQELEELADGLALRDAVRELRNREGNP